MVYLAHLFKLQKVCRIGGGKFSRLSRTKNYPCESGAGEIQACFGVDITGDVDDIHHTHFCNSCKKVLGRNQNALSSLRFVVVAVGHLWIGSHTKDQGVHL